MDYPTAKKQITAFFATQWGNTTKVAYPDDEFTKPNKNTWVRMTIKHFDGHQASIGSPGSNRFRRTGLLTFQVFQKEGTAGLDADQKANQIVNIFLAATNSDIRYYDVQLREIGNDGDGWYQINVLVYFEYDHIA